MAHRFPKGEKFHFEKDAKAYEETDQDKGKGGNAKAVVDELVTEQSTKGTQPILSTDLGILPQVPPRKIEEFILVDAPSEEIGSEREQ